MYIGDDRTDEDAFKVTIFFPSSPRPSSAHDYNNNTFCIFCSTRAWVSGARRWKLNQVLRDRGHGVGIVVSKVPKETSASYSLQEPSEVYILSNYQHVHMLDICCPSDHFFCFFLKLLLWTYAYRLWTSCGGWSNGRGMHSGQACSHHNSEKPWYDGLTPQKQNFGTFKIDCPEKRDGQ